MRTAKRITTACLTAIMIFQALAPSTEVFAQELDAVMDPALYTGRCAQQVERFLSECAPLLADAQSADGAISL